MFAIIAAVLFAIAFILQVTATATEPVFAPLSLTFVGLTLLALHMAGMGPTHTVTRRRR